MLCAFLLTCVRVAVGETNCNVLDFGAVGNLKTLDTTAIQRAIDVCHEQGGGVVRLPAGEEFLSGTLVLKDNVTLEVEKGAMLRGSRDLSDYLKTVPDVKSYAVINFSDYALIQAINVTNVGVQGGGIIDGDGVAVPGRTGYGHLKTRPYLLRFIRCENVTVRGVMLKDPNFWTQHYLECDHVHVDGVRVRALNLDPHQPNADGIDIDGCQHVLIENMDIESEDDGITLKSTSLRPMRHVLIRNNRIRSNVNAIKFGTETHGRIEDVMIRDNRVAFAGRAALSVLCVDGGQVENITFENIEIEQAAVPLVVRLGDRGRGIKFYKQAVSTFNRTARVRGPDDPPVGVLRNITFRNIVSKDVGSALPPKTMARSVGSAFSGVHGHMIENLVLENLDLTYAGGARVYTNTCAGVEERPAHYPSAEMFGELPAFGFFFRHVDGLRMTNVTIRVLEPDSRSALVFNNVWDAQMQGVRVPRNVGESPIMDSCAGTDASEIAAHDQTEHSEWVIRGQIPPRQPVSPRSLGVPK